MQWRSWYRMQATDIRGWWNCGLPLKRIMHDDRGRTTPSADMTVGKGACHQATRGLIKWASGEWHKSTGLTEIPTADQWSNTYGTHHYFARPDRITFIALAEQPCPLRPGYTGANTRLFSQALDQPFWMCGNSLSVIMHMTDYTVLRYAQTKCIQTAMLYGTGRYLPAHSPQKVMVTVMRTTFIIFPGAPFSPTNASIFSAN